MPGTDRCLESLTARVAIPSTAPGLKWVTMEDIEEPIWPVDLRDVRLWPMESEDGPLLQELFDDLTDSDPRSASLAWPTR